MIGKRLGGVALLAASAALVLSGCTGNSAAGSTGGGTASTAASTSGTSPATSSAPSSAPAVPDAALVLSPATGAADVNPATPITAAVTGGTITAVTLTNSDGKAVAGAVGADGKSWTASEPLGYGKAYTLTAAATNTAGKAATSTSTFKTLTPANMTMPYINITSGGTLADGAVYGVGIVPVVHFDEKITDKAAAERALVVTTTPAVVGSWYWADDQNVHWRPQNYYATGTKVTVSANLYGVQVGPGLYGQASLAKSFTIGDKHVSISDDTTHQVSVYFNDVLQRTMPTSMGKGGYATGTDGQKISFYTPSGTYTVIEKDQAVVMDSSTYGLPVNGPGGYKETIAWATKISTDGIYLHQLNSTVWAQGHRDTSHGCLNLNQANAIWYQQTAQIGDVVQVVNTGGAPLALWQNGDWTLTWDQWTAGSALH